MINPKDADCSNCKFGGSGFENEPCNRCKQPADGAPTEWKQAGLKKITIIQAPEKPITLMGVCAGICYGKPTEQYQFGTQAFNRGFDCIQNRHGRVMEFPDVIVKIEGYSARVIRELYTHIVGVTRLQESTRYVDMTEFECYMPDSIRYDKDARHAYESLMLAVKATYNELLERGVSKEDAANVLPLGSYTTIVLKINFRAILHMGEERKCNRAYNEFRTLMNNFCNTLSEYSEEWELLMNMVQPKCEYLKFCPESRGCGRYPKRGE